MKLGGKNSRLIADIKHKIGLSYLSFSLYDKSVAALKESAKYLDDVIVTIKEEAQKASTEATIVEIEEKKHEILNKITELEEKIAEVYWWPFALIFYLMKTV